MADEPVWVALFEEAVNDLAKGRKLSVEQRMNLNLTNVYLATILKILREQYGR